MNKLSDEISENLKRGQPQKENTQNGSAKSAPKPLMATLIQKVDKPEEVKKTPEETKVPETTDAKSTDTTESKSIEITEAQATEVVADPKSTEGSDDKLIDINDTENQVDYSEDIAECMDHSGNGESSEVA